MNETLSKLKLKRPICFIDLETTGLNTEQDRIVEITICKIYPDGSNEVKTKIINPEIPISDKATEVHGITNDQVAKEPPFHKFAKGMFKFIEGCDVVGYNSNSYDLPMLYFEFSRCGLEWDYKSIQMVDVCNIFRIKEPRDLSAAYKFFCDKDLVNSHSSKADIFATVEIFASQLEKYDLPTDLSELAHLSNYGKEIVDIGRKFTKDDDGETLFNFGPHKGKKCLDEKGFLEWMIGGKPTFTTDIHKIVKDLLGITEEKEAANE